MIKVKLAGIERMVTEQQVIHYESFGWQRVIDKPDERMLAPKRVDSGTIKAKARKAPVPQEPAEPAPETAQEDLGNDITKGE